MIFYEYGFRVMIYIVVASILVVLSLAEISVNQKIFREYLLIFVTLGLVVLTGLRTWGGSDFEVYRDYYVDVDGAKVQYGFLYEYINRIVNWLGLDYTGFLMLIAAIVVPAQLYFFSKSSKYPVTATFIFFTTNFVWLDHVIIRTSLASALVLMAALAFVKRKLLCSVVCVFIASWIHASAAAAWLIWLAFKRVRYASILMVPLLVVLAYAVSKLTIDWSSLADWLSPNIERYLVENEGVSISNILELAFAFVLYRLVPQKYEKWEIVLYNGVLRASLFITLIAYTIAAAARFLEYSRFFYIVIFMKYIESRPCSNRILFCLPFYLYGLAKIYHFCTTFDGGAAYDAYLQQ